MDLKSTLLYIDYLISSPIGTICSVLMSSLSWGFLFLHWLSCIDKILTQLMVHMVVSFVLSTKLSCLIQPSEVTREDLMPTQIQFSPLPGNFFILRYAGKHFCIETYILVLSVVKAVNRLKEGGGRDTQTYRGHTDLLPLRWWRVACCMLVEKQMEKPIR